MSAGLDRPSPQSLDAEHAVLGALLLNGEAMDRLDGLQAGHFYGQAHQRIFSAIQQILSAGQAVDVLTVADALASAGLSASCGGMAYLAELASNTPGTRNVTRYAKIVRDKSIERQLLAAADEVIALVLGAGETHDKLAAAQSAIMMITEASAPKQARPIGDALADKLAELERRAAGEGRGIPTGLVDLDEDVHIQPGDLVLIAGRPSMGKTAFAMDLAKRFAEGEYPVGVFSMEMSEGQLLDRLIANIGHVPLKHVLAGYVGGASGDGIMTAMGRLQTLPLYVDESGGLNIHDLLARARSMVRRFGIKVLMVDYLGLLDMPADKLVAGLGEATRLLKAFAKNYGVVVFALAQLSRKVEERTDKRPMMSDLRDSGNLEQDADIIIMKYREEYYKPDTQDKGIAEAIVRKNRQGEPKTIGLAFLADQQRYENLASGWTPSPSSAPGKPARLKDGF